MLLSFEHSINLTTYEDNPPPKVVQQLSIIHEAEDGEVVQYYIDPDNIPGDKNSFAIGVYNNQTYQYDYHYYTDLLWNKPRRRITTRKADRLGIKAFPGVGACAFYKLAYQVLSKIVIPVNHRQKLYPFPTQEVTITGNNMHFVFTDPEKVTYQCYRVVLRCGEYAEEHITYEHELDCPLPQMNGEYEATTQGYISEGEEVSELSPEFLFTVNIPGQSDQPPTTTAGSDIFVSGLRFTDDNYLRATLTDGRNVDSSNKLPATGVVFWRVRYYDDGVLKHKEYVEDGDNATWSYLDNHWATAPGGSEDPNARQNIRANRNLYYVHDRSWATGSDEEVAAAIDAAQAGTLDLQRDLGWAVGDTRTVRIAAFTNGEGVTNAAEDVKLVLTSFDQYRGCGNVVQFDFWCCPSTACRLRPVVQSDGGYANTEMYTTTLPALVNALPTWIKNRLKTFSVLANNGEPSYAVESVANNKLALRSASELFGSSGWNYPSEGAQLPYYQEQSHRMKGLGIDRTSPGYATYHWTRSAAANVSYYVVDNTGGGGGNTSNPNSTGCGFAPFGCL